MGRHVWLPLDPVAKAAEKKRRFKAYQKEWKQRRRAESARKTISAYRLRRELARAAGRLNIDLCLELGDLTVEQLRKSIATAEGWIEGAYRSKAEQQRDLEMLNREFSKLSRRMIDEAGVNYMDLPFDLHHFNQQRLSKLMYQYGGTDAKNLFLEAAGLYAARELVKSRPVIK